MIHGDSRDHPGEASNGCIVMQANIRRRIAKRVSDRAGIASMQTVTLYVSDRKSVV